MVSKCTHPLPRPQAQTAAARSLHKQFDHRSSRPLRRGKNPKLDHDAMIIRYLQPNRTSDSERSRFSRATAVVDEGTDNTKGCQLV